MIKMSFSLLMLLFFLVGISVFLVGLQQKHRGWTWLGLGLSVLAAIMFVAVVFLRSCF
ncbi:hypothetical protein LCAZH_0374 [Lacticaseibacillus paracasei]|nr:hypothetical protein LCAZH_0374 [Lacticaseibacillus paracasei]EEI69320.1 hypothetical protein HMPREF0530_0437 [Lacticaseibacillus paracasei subsp. paracasei ATCC 25302 = DSM 5622 = JCM 8130]EPC26000.1 Hypothetical protein Lpp46_1832 [Lacticaseibacillus paracasei subsp. paracasei Lpp46]EPC28872.1 Hypothetical protein Lpp17_0081 [Lacticaseibacillus paracasei subsp. paracasei Lpp17]KRK14805.1 hypothetical protein FC13_GL001924 [Lacticaseibacillus casei DSM 20011 = JCM 1134 = ATCC 393]BAN70617.